MTIEDTDISRDSLISGKGDFKDAPKPSLDLLVAIDEPSVLYSTYMTRYKFRILLGLFVTCGTLAFEVMFPFELGELVDITRRLNKNIITPEEFDNYLDKIFKFVGYTSLCTTVCQWIQSDVFLITAARISKDMRYDLYYCYF
jgi:hypothetical protein